MPSLDFSPALIGSDTIDFQSSDSSPITDAITKGVPSAAISGLLSIYNTYQAVTGGEISDTSKTIRQYDEQWGNYYDDHKAGVDVAGFLATSLIPGTLGMKALKLAQAGEAVGPVGRALGFFGTRKNQYLDQAISQLAKTGGTVTAEVNAAKWGAFTWGVADQALTASASELAVAATMAQSPIFDDAHSFGAYAWNIALGAGVGGVLGGALEHFATRGILNQVQSKIQAARRNVDTMGTAENLGLLKGNELQIFAENLVAMGPAIDTLNFDLRRVGSKVTEPVTLNVKDALTRASETAQRTALQNMALKFNELAGGNEHIGQGYFDFVAKLIKDGKSSGRLAEDITSDVAGYLQNVKGIRAIIPTEQGAEGTTAFFVNKAPKDANDVFTSSRSATTTKQAYYLSGNATGKIKTTIVDSIEVGNPELQAAFKAGADVAATKDGRIVINPASKLVRKGEEEGARQTFFVDVEKGTLQGEEVVVHAADTMRKLDDFLGHADAIYIGGKKYAQASTAISSIKTTALNSSARFMWARELKAGWAKNAVVDIRDFPLIERLIQDGPTEIGSTKTLIKMADGTTTPLSDIVDLRSLVQQQKLEHLEMELAGHPNTGPVYNPVDGKPLLGKAAGIDTRQIAAALGVKQSWVERAIERGFNGDSHLLSDADVASLGSYFRPKNVAVDFDTSMRQTMATSAFTGPNHAATTELSHQYQLKIQLQQSENAFRASMGADASRFPTTPDELGKLTSEAGAGATMGGASNASYGKQAELLVQYVGSQATQVMQKNRDAAIEAISPQLNKIRDNIAASAELGVLTTALRRDPNKYRVMTELAEDGETLTYRLVDKDVLKLLDSGVADDLEHAIEMLGDQGRKGAYEIQNPAVGEFLQQHIVLNDARLEKLNPLYSATGQVLRAEKGLVYIPPVDTRRYPFFAFVVPKERIGNDSIVSMITAKDSTQLKALAESVPDTHFVQYKDDTAAYFKAKGRYDYDAGLNESKVNADMKREGKLGDFHPETRAQNILEDYVRWHATQEENVVRRGVEVKYRQFISELDFLSQQYLAPETSMFKGKVASLEKRIADPFGDYKKTLLGLSKQSEYPLLDSLNEFVDKIGKNLYEKLDAIVSNPNKGLLDYEQVNKLTREAGLGSPYQGVQDYLEANAKYPRNLIKDAFQKANAILSTTILRNDFINPLINAISTPIMVGTEVASIKTLIRNDPELVGQLQQLMSVGVPGQPGKLMPSTTSMLGKAFGNMFGQGKEELFTRFEQIGAIPTDVRKYFDALNEMAFQPHVAPNKFIEGIKSGADKLATLTGNDWAERATRFVSADVMKQITDPLIAAGKIDVQTQNAYISSFVNRVQGNYVNSQRPIIFQGTTGAAVGLFQTYTFNVLQQLLRHVENRDQKALWTFAGLQSSVYGLNGLPFFDAINTHLIGEMAAGNPNHRDAYSAAAGFNLELGNWMLYGTASAFPLFGDKAPALYSRGDINPRHLSILPINPLDIPSVSASLKLYDSIVNFGKNVANGADMSGAMLQALEHQGLSRPLAGFAQALAGQSTTSKGSLISSANDLETTAMLARIPDRAVQFGGAVRMLGARPMDEAVALNQYYRMKTYQADDRAKIDQLGQAVKTTLYNNQMPDSATFDKFMTEYATRGGRIENFSASLQRWSKDANVSIVNQMRDKLQTPYRQNLQMIMGAGLDDNR